MSIYLDSSYLNDDIKLEETKKSDQTSMLTASCITMVLNQLNTVDQVSMSAIAAPAATAPSAASSAPAPSDSFQWPQDDTQPMPPSWFTDTSVPDNQLDAEEKLEKMLKWQEENPMNINGEIYMLQYMINFANTYPNDPLLDEKSSSGKDYATIMLTLMVNLMASVCVDSNFSSSAFKAALTEMDSLFKNSNSPLLRDVDDYFKNHYTQIGFYTDNYGKDTWDTFLLKAGGTLCLLGMKTISPFIHKIYQQILKDIGTTDPFMLYIALLAVLADEEADFEMDIIGTANVLSELAVGERTVGNASSALSIIMNLNGYGSPTDINHYITAFNQNMDKALNDPNSQEAQAYNDLKTRDPELANDLNDLYQVTSTNGDDYTKYDANAQKEVSDDLAKILDQYNSHTSNTDITSDLNILFSSIDTPDISGIDDLNSWYKSVQNYNDGDYKNACDSAQTLAESILYLQAMGDDLNDSMLPGLKSLTDRLTKDFESLTGVTDQDLQDAANGNQAAEQKIVDGVSKLVPQDPNQDTHGLTTINNDLNSITTYFNNHNSAEQAEAQYLSGMVEQMLSFMKQMYNQPGQLDAAIQTHLQSAGQ